MLAWSPNTFYYQVISHFYTFPTVIPVHGIITPYDRSYPPCRTVHVLFQFPDKAQTTFRVRIPSVHKTMDESPLYAIFLGYVTKFLQMFYGTMDASIGQQSHKMHLFVIVAGVCESLYDFRILHDAVITASLIDAHQILVHNASCPYIQVTDFRISHLSVRQTYIFTTSQQLGMGIFLR